MLTIILTTYLVLSLFVGIIIYAACVVASRSDKALENGLEHQKARRIMGVKRVPAKPAPSASNNEAMGNPSAKRAASVFYRS